MLFRWRGTRWVVSTVLVGLLILAGLSAAWSAAWRSQKVVPRSYPGAEIHFPGVNKAGANVGSEPGLLLIRAETAIRHPFRTPKYWWFVEIRIKDPASGEMKPIFQTEYDHQAFMAPQGEEIRPTFSDTYALPSGEYLVHAGLKEEARVVDKAGNLLNVNPIIASASYWAEVQ